MSNTSILVVAIMIFAQATSDPFNWNALVTLAMAILLAWNTYRSQKRDKEVSEAKEAMKEAAAEVKSLAVKVEKVPEIAAAVSKVEAHVNSQKTADTAKIESQEREIKNLTGLLAERKATAELLAQSAAITAAAPAVPAAAAPAPTKVEIVSSEKDPVLVSDVTGPKKK